jgi:hypothetical protein
MQRLRPWDFSLALFLTEAGGVRVTPYDPEFERQMTIAREVMKSDRDMLRELAKR